MTAQSATSIQGRWSCSRRDFGTVLWVSFLGACFGSLIIFGLLDPEAMTGAWTEKWDMGREWGYTLGFGFLWMVSFVASALTIYMVRTGPCSGYAAGLDPQRPVAEKRSSNQAVPGLKDGKVVGHDES